MPASVRASASLTNLIFRRGGKATILLESRARESQPCRSHRRVESGRNVSSHPTAAGSKSGMPKVTQTRASGSGVGSAPGVASAGRKRGQGRAASWVSANTNVPEAPDSGMRLPKSMPASRRISLTISKSSSPTYPVIATLTPKRDAASAAVSPLPAKRSSCSGGVPWISRKMPPTTRTSVNSAKGCLAAIPKRTDQARRPGPATPRRVGETRARPCRSHVEGGRFRRFDPDPTTVVARGHRLLRVPQPNPDFGAANSLSLDQLRGTHKGTPGAISHPGGASLQLQAAPSVAAKLQRRRSCLPCVRGTGNVEASHLCKSVRIASPRGYSLPHRGFHRGPRSRQRDAGARSPWSQRAPARS